MNPENVQRSKFILSQYIEKVEISNEKIKATFKVAFSNSGEESVVAEYKEEKSINRKLLLNVWFFATKGDNFEFLILRVSQGTDLDDRFEENARNANLHDIPIGVYCFNNYTNNNYLWKITKKYWKS